MSSEGKQYRDYCVSSRQRKYVQLITRPRQEYFTLTKRQLFYYVAQWSTDLLNVVLTYFLYPEINVHSFKLYTSSWTQVNSDDRL